MKVTLSGNARAYIKQETQYLRDRSASGAAAFREIVLDARAILARHPDSGLTQSAITLVGARRLVLRGYHFDYDVTDDAVVILAVRSSVNTPSPDLDDTDDDA
ncbi:type II toxin-antitoxin system RelE/ParE family toxin [Devosia sp. SL43]|uniref:type II toxin-antitoxin system RelE/ParE family toxin n=1 Tax=Devosia sp. SL43 TaxID=2806348 RepID=UPI001F27C8CE|nr:type II toxin-antitoxin system RelE/ParE family toxin [Devosia sp. SL43]UJW84472.1 type II toxin-antitoxin system RelE/ParE family toxin [Devosia sp. SL43]